MKKLSSNKKQLIVFTIYLFFTFILIFFHENWRDEAQAWLLVRDCNIVELIEAMKYEGHFLLWYFILMPFAKLGFPYITTNIISWIITSITVLLILKKAPFKFYKRALLIFTLPLLYLFPIISRCYCLIPLAIVLMCIFYKDRKEKPFRYLISTILLLNTHVIMIGMFGMVLLDYIIELIMDWKKQPKDKINRRLICIIITIVLMIISILPLVSCLTTNKDIGYDENMLLKIIYAIFYYPIVIIIEMYNFFSSNLVITTIILAIIFLIAIYEIKNNPLDFFKIYMCILWQCLIYSFIYKLSLQRASAVVFVLLYFKWIQTYKKAKMMHKLEKKIIDICWMMLVIINIVGGILYILHDEILIECSNAYNVGDYINENLGNDSIILNGPRVEFATSIIPYVNKNVKFYHIQGNRYFSYAIWDEKNRQELYIEDIENLRNIFDENQELYYIYCKNKSDVGEEVAKVDEKNVVNACIEKGVFKEIYTTNEVSINYENFVLYEVILSNI